MDILATKARMQQKHDIASNWENAESFVPKPGEIIVYDKDEYVEKQRIKIGDGESHIKELSSITGEVYTSKAEPKNASEGAIWISDDNLNTLDYGFAQKNIVGYRYNNIPFPVLPNWNKAAFPFGMILREITDYYFYIVSSVPVPKYDSTQVLSTLDFIAEDEGVSGYKIRRWHYSDLEKRWVSIDLEMEKTTWSIPVSQVVWVNINIYNEETLAFGFTEPVPIYEDAYVDFEKPDWNIQDRTSTGFIRNKPVWYNQTSVSIPWRKDADEYVLFEKTAKYMSNLTPTIREISNLSVRVTSGAIPFTNMTPPVLPEYDTIAFPYQVLDFKYQPLQEDWDEVELYYSIGPFVCVEDETLGTIITNPYSAYSRKYNLSNLAWEEEAYVSPRELALTYTLNPSEEVGSRIISNHNIFYENQNTVYLDAYEPSPILHGLLCQPEKYITTNSELSEIMISENADLLKIYVINGVIKGLASNCYIIATLSTIEETITLVYLGLILNSYPTEDYPFGIYFFKDETDENASYLAEMSFDYSSIKVNELYDSVFKKPEASNVYFFDSVAINNLIETKDPALLEAELKKYKSGDVILLPAELLSGFSL